MTETWMPTPIAGYEVSDQGRVRGPRGLLKPERLHNGYLRIHLGGPRGVRRRYRVHLLVLNAFVGPQPPDCTAAHVNGNRSDNHLTNLAWKDAEGQLDDRRKHGTASSGSRSNQRRLKADEVRQIKTLLEKQTPVRIVAAQFNTSADSIYDIRSGKTWSYIL